jgi:hypothetical protein
VGSLTQCLSTCALLLSATPRRHCADQIGAGKDFLGPLAAVPRHRDHLGLIQPGCPAKVRRRGTTRVKKSAALIGDGGRGFCAWTAVCARPDESLSGNRIREVKGSTDQGGGKRAWLRDLDEKTLFRDGHHRMNDRVVGLCVQEKLGRSAMKTLLAGIAFAIGIVFASQAFALPCPKGMWQGGHYVCADFDE